MPVPVDRTRMPPPLLCHMEDTLLLTYLLCTSILNSGVIPLHFRVAGIQCASTCNCLSAGWRRESAKIETAERKQGVIPSLCRNGKSPIICYALSRAGNHAVI